MKLTVRQLILAAFIGGIIGFCISFVLMAIAIPSYTNYLLHRSMYEELLNLAELLPVDISPVIVTVMFAALTVTWWLIASQVNEVYRQFSFKRLNRPWLAIAIFVIAGVVFYTGVLEATNLLNDLGKSTDITFRYIMLLVFTVALSWLLISPQGFGQFSEAFVMPSKQQLLNTVLWGAGFALFLGAVLNGLVSVVFQVYFQIVVEALDRSMESSTYGFKALSIGLAVILAISSVIIISMVRFFVPRTIEIKARIRESKTGLVISAGTLLIILIMIPTLTGTFHINKSNLIEAAELEDINATELTLVRFCGDDQCRRGIDRKKTIGRAVQVSEWFRELIPFEGVASSNKGIPLNKSLLADLQQFVLDKGQLSVYRKIAIDAMPEIYRKLWQPYKAFHALDELKEAGELPFGSSIIWPIYHQIWLNHSAPITEANRLDLEKISDPEKYFYKGKYTTRLANTWRRFGDEGRAQRLYQQAEQEYETADEKEQVVQPPEFINGEISGRVQLKGKQMAGMRIGLFSIEPLKNSNNAMKIPYPGDITRIVASQKLNEEGHFNFQHLTDGLYAIAMLVPSAQLPANSALEGLNVPGVIRLIAEKPSYVADITLTQK